MIYKVLHELDHLHTNKFFPMRNSITRRAKNKLYLPHVTASVWANSFIYRAGTEYVKKAKRFPPSLRLSSFKRALNKFLNSG